MHMSTQPSTKSSPCKRGAWAAIYAKAPLYRFRCGGVAGDGIGLAAAAALLLMTLVAGDCGGDGDGDVGDGRCRFPRLRRHIYWITIFCARFRKRSGRFGQRPFAVTDSSAWLWSLAFIYTHTHSQTQTHAHGTTRRYLQEKCINYLHCGDEACSTNVFYYRGCSNGDYFNYPTVRLKGALEMLSTG